MTERQLYYRNLIEYLVEQDYKVEVNPTKDAEAPLPNVRLDMLFEIPVENLCYSGKSPFSFFRQVNIVHIKAFQDRLTRDDVVQYLGETYILSVSSPLKEKETALTIISAEKIGRSVSNGLYSSIEKTDTPWVYQIGAEVPAFIFVIDEIPEEKIKEKYKFFLPFQSLSRLKATKKIIQEIAQEKSPENDMILYWLGKLQPDFFEDIVMKIDTDDLVKTLYPKTLERNTRSTLLQAVANVLKTRFGEDINTELSKKINAIESIETLNSLLSLAVILPLEDFEKQLP